MTKTTLAAILTHARELFRSRGYAGTSMNDLADRVGVRKASLYSRVSDKEALVADVLRLTLDEVFDFKGDGLEWQEAFATGLERLAGQLREHGRCVGLHLAYGLPDEAVSGREAVTDFFLACRDRLAAALRQGMDGDLAERMATEAIASIEGASLWLVVTGDGAPLDRAVERAIGDAAAWAAELPDPRARETLQSLGRDWRFASAVEKALAARLVEARDRIQFVEEALRGQVEAESCFR